MEHNQFSRLRRFNLIMGAFHLIQGVAMLFLATSVIQNIAEFKPTIIQFYLTYDPQSQSLVSASKDLFTLPFGILVAVFLLLSAFFHALIAVPKRTNDMIFVQHESSL
jgi:succinate dehydrogenase/fumarate reductase cytochrome b subunit